MGMAVIAATPTRASQRLKNASLSSYTATPKGPPPYEDSTTHCDTTSREQHGQFASIKNQSMAVKTLSLQDACFGKVCQCQLREMQCLDSQKAYSGVDIVHNASELVHD